MVCGIYLLSHKTYGGIDCFQYISKPVEGSSIHIPPMGGIYFELPLSPYPFGNVIWYLMLPRKFPVVIECFDSQDLISNSPYCVLHNSYGVCLGNLDLDQLLILKLITVLVTCQLDIVRINSVLVSHGS